MSDIEKEKDLVASLRNQGMTLQEIANKLSKSIYWVNSRLDDKYKPKRVRQTASYRDNSSNHIHIEMVDNPKLSEEIDRVKKMRESGMTYEQIAEKLNRSIYWVHTRLSKKYTPRVTMNEKIF
jgi:orotate phosphoribosyltransferase-like protein